MSTIVKKEVPTNDESTSKEEGKKVSTEAVTMGYETTVEDKKLIVKINESSYKEMAKKAGITDKTILDVKALNDKFIKSAVQTTEDALIKGYKEHSDATGFEVRHITPFNNITISGNKDVKGEVNGTPFHTTGFTMKLETSVYALQSAQKNAKKRIFDSFNA